MNASKNFIRLAPALLFVLGFCSGCETTGNDGAQVNNYYYGVGYYDPWYHGDYYEDRDVIVVPPRPNNPPDQGLRPSHPIATPPQVSNPSPQPRPSIPTRPRPAPRGGGRR
jgi:hypothetical protein